MVMLYRVHVGFINVLHANEKLQSAQLFNKIQLYFPIFCKQSEIMLFMNRVVGASMPLVISNERLYLKITETSFRE